MIRVFSDIHNPVFRPTVQQWPLHHFLWDFKPTFPQWKTNSKMSKTDHPTRSKHYATGSSENRTPNHRHQIPPHFSQLHNNTFAKHARFFFKQLSEMTIPDSDKSSPELIRNQSQYKNPRSEHVLNKNKKENDKLDFPGSLTIAGDTVHRNVPMDSHRATTRCWHLNAAFGLAGQGSNKPRKTTRTHRRIALGRSFSRMARWRSRWYCILRQACGGPASEQ